MLEFIQNIGSKVFDFFSNKFGSVRTKRQLESLDGETSASTSKRLKFDMEADSNPRFKVVDVRREYSDRYYYRKKESQTNGRPFRTALPGGQTTFHVDSSNNSQELFDVLTTPMVSVPSEGKGRVSNIQTKSGFSFSSASQEVQNCEKFQFGNKSDIMEFQGSSCSTLNHHSLVNQSGAYTINSRLNNLSDQERHDSVFNKILGNNISRGVKNINTRKRNRLAVKQCIRLNEKIKYKELLDYHMAHHPSSDFLPSFSVEHHKRPSGRNIYCDSIWNVSSSLSNSGVSSGSMLDIVRDEMKNRVDAHKSLLLSAMSVDKDSFPRATAESRQFFAMRKKSVQDGIPEKTFQTLQQQKMKDTMLNKSQKKAVASVQHEKSFGPNSPTLLIMDSPISNGSLNFEARQRMCSDLGHQTVSSPLPTSCVQNAKSKDKSVLETRSGLPEAFEKALKESKYAGEEFLHRVDSRTESEFARQERIEKESVVKYYREQREKNETKLINKMQKLLLVSQRLPIPLEETFIEEPDAEIIDNKEETESQEEQDENELVEASDEFLELTEEQEAAINKVLVPRPADQVLVEGFRLQITRKDFATLSGLNWLNDEIINFYFSMVMERSKKDGFSKVYAFNTFFYPKVKSEGHKGVRRWTKNIDVFSFSYILVPVHLGMHWCLAVVDFRKKQIRYYDSMGGRNDECLTTLRNYLSQESQAKSQQMLDWTDWQLFAVKDIPQQMNGSDCGMFACKFAEYISRDAPITFDQRHMPYFRRRMIYEILTKTLM